MFGRFVEKLKGFLFGKERGEDQIEETGNSMLYIGILTLVFVFLGYVTQTIITNLNITDINSLPVFGPVLGPLQNTLTIGATVLLVLFLLLLVAALVGIVRWLRARATS